MSTPWPQPDPNTVTALPLSQPSGWSTGRTTGAAPVGVPPWLLDERVDEPLAGSADESLDPSVDESIDEQLSDAESSESTVDFRQFRSTGVTAAVLAASVRMLAFFLLAGRHHHRIVIRYFLDQIPYPAVLANRANFATLVSQSTLVAAAIMLAFFLVASLRHMKRNQAVTGWFIGIIGCGEMLLVDIVRHVLSPPVVVFATVLWTLWPIILGVVVLAILRPSAHRAVKADASDAQESSGSALDA